MTLHTQLLQITAALPKGDATRKQILVALQRHAGMPNPPAEVLGLFESFKREGLIADRMRVKDLISDFLTTTGDIVVSSVEDDCVYDDADDGYEEEGEADHPDFGEMAYTVEFPHALYGECRGSASYGEIAAKAFARVKAKDVGVRLMGSAAFQKYLRGCIPYIQAEAEHDYRVLGADLWKGLIDNPGFTNQVSAWVADSDRLEGVEVRTSDFDFSASLSSDKDNIEMEVHRGGVQWSVGVYYDVKLEDSSVTLSGGEYTEQGLHEMGEDARYDELEDRGREMAWGIYANTLRIASKLPVGNTTRRKLLTALKG